MSTLKDVFRPTDSPPAGLAAKFRHYSSRYGAVHAAARYVGTKVPSIWRLVGPAVSGGYRRNWTAPAGVPRLLNLGGGGNTIQNGLTVDLDPRADSYVDLAQSLPFADASFDLILLEEVLEHVPKPEGVRLLRECRRILAPNGVIRITTPDLDWMGVGAADGTVDCDLINSTFYDHGHRYIYSRRELLRAMEQAGFAKAAHSFYRDPDAVLGFLDTHAARFDHAPELSQYVEATR